MMTYSGDSFIIVLLNSMIYYFSLQIYNNATLTCIMGNGRYILPGKNKTFTLTFCSYVLNFLLYIMK